ncbi:hypothetical protein ACTMTF_34715 [Nonomuraea sp. ZG12]|uniref:hypothetical protein n=1 Tax=Nonomuraea sp. ZG12 TaxID=3452207 RepID=UPI003F88F39A
MSITTRTCLVVTCTRCGQVDPDEGYETLHADTIDQLRDWLTDWEWSGPDTPEFCPGCVADLACERDGHLWRDWQPGVTSTGLRFRFRSCERCHAGEREPAPAPPPPPVAPDGTGEPTS